MHYPSYKGENGYPVGCSQTSIRFYVRKFIQEFRTQKRDWKKLREKNIKPFLVPLSLLEDLIALGKLSSLTKEQKKIICDKILVILDSFLKASAAGGR